MGQFVQFFRGIQLAGLNSLEWAGVICTVSIGVYGLMRLRDHFSGSGKSASPVKAAPTPINGKQTLKDLPKGNETVLIVDDDPAVLRAHARLVSKLGYNTQRALGGQDAVNYIRNSHADLIVLDLLMPGMDGIETFRHIRDINPYQKAIVLSGFAGPAMVNSIKTLGVNTYLVKPAEIGILAKAIRDEIDRP